METHIAAAYADSIAAGVTRKTVTPDHHDPLLKRTGGPSHVTNNAVIKKNPPQAAEIAVALAKT
jgi:pseudouridine-5'-phosphate glycosidase